MSWNDRYDNELLKQAAPLYENPTWVGKAPCGANECTACAFLKRKLDSAADRLVSAVQKPEDRKTQLRDVGRALDYFEVSNRDAQKHVSQHNGLVNFLQDQYDKHIAPLSSLYQKHVKDSEGNPERGYPHVALRAFNELLSQHVDTNVPYSHETRKNLRNVDRTFKTPNTWKNGFQSLSQQQINNAK